MTVTESKGLKKGARVYWQGDAGDSGIITETSWDAVTIAWENGKVARVHHGDMREISANADKAAYRVTAAESRSFLQRCSIAQMKVEEIAEVVARLSPDQLARFWRWFAAFEAGRHDHAKELDSTATKLGRLAGRALAELKKRANEP
jgi:hypothetical protein